MVGSIFKSDGNCLAFPLCFAGGLGQRCEQPFVKFGACLLLVFSCLCLQSQQPGQKTTVIGELSRLMAVGGESTGWAIVLESRATIDGKEVDSLQISYGDTGKLEQLENKHVVATGNLTHRRGVESGEQPVLEVSAIKETKTMANSAHSSSGSFSLAGSEWRLEDLSGSRVLDNVQATLAFPELGKVAGNGSCNRFFGTAEINGPAIKLGPLASTRMACAEEVMNQETKYLETLQSAEHFEWKDPYLVVYCKGFEKPLRFKRMEKPMTP
jgi:heat shock protein HslJ